MDPIAFYSGLFEISSSLATIVNIALNTKAGQKILDSSLKELPILFSLVEEMKDGVLKSSKSIPKSTVLAFTACQADLSRLVKCLSQRGLIGFRQSRAGFSELQSQLSDTVIEAASETSLNVKKRTSSHRSLKEMIHLFDFDTLDKAVKSFKESVLMLHNIAMNFYTHSLLQSQTIGQHTVVNELEFIRSMLGTPSSAARNTDADSNSPETEHIDASIDVRRYKGGRVLQKNVRPTIGNNTQQTRSTHSITRVVHLDHGNVVEANPQKLPSQQGPLKVEKYSTLFNLVVCVPQRSASPSEVPLEPLMFFAKAVLDTGSAKNMISEEVIGAHKFEHLVERLKKEVVLTLGDGVGVMTSVAIVKLTWYNTHDAMRTYTTTFHVVQSEIFDMLLGKEFYAQYGAPLRDTSKEMMMGFFSLPQRSKKQWIAEQKAAKDAEDVAKESLRQQHENATNAAAIEATQEVQEAKYDRPIQQARGSEIEISAAAEVVTPKLRPVSGPQTSVDDKGQRPDRATIVDPATFAARQVAQEFVANEVLEESSGSSDTIQEPTGRKLIEDSNPIGQLSGPLTLLDEDVPSLTGDTGVETSDASGPSSLSEGHHNIPVMLVGSSRAASEEEIILSRLAASNSKPTIVSLPLAV